MTAQGERRGNEAHNGREWNRLHVADAMRVLNSHNSTQEMFEKLVDLDARLNARWEADAMFNKHKERCCGGVHRTLQRAREG